MAEIENSAETAPRILARADGATIAYHRREGDAPGIVFLPGFRSDMNGAKALALDALCAARGKAFVRFDYFAHGQSSGDILEGCIGRWRDDILAVVDELTQGPQILVGSSMGGWLALLAKRARPKRVAGLVLVAPAVDFTEKILDYLPAEGREAVARDGVYYAPSQYSDESYPFTRLMIEDGANNLLLDKPLPLDCPVRILHGMADPDISWRESITLAEKLGTDDVVLTAIKGGDHRLSNPADIDRIGAAVTELWGN